MNFRKTRISSTLGLFALLAAGCNSAPSGSPEPASISGIYPSLAMYNQEGECGTGAIVPWGDQLWVVTYGPHLPNGSSDKLYAITPDLRQVRLAVAQHIFYIAAAPDIIRTQQPDDIH